MVKRVYEFAEQPMSGEVQQAIESFIAANPRGRLGRIEYHLEDFGLDPRERRQALRFYQERYDVPDEGLGVSTGGSINWQDPFGSDDGALFGTDILSSQHSPSCRRGQLTREVAFVWYHPIFPPTL